jgi:hypothetical protein
MKRRWIPVLAAIAAGFLIAEDAKKPISISLGVPTLWTVDEAHYLLAQMRAANTGLSTKMPSPDDLNSNGMNVSQLETLKSAFSLDVSYSQGAAVRNSLAIEKYQADSARRSALQAARDSYVRQSLVLDDQIASMKGELATLAVKGTTDDAKKALQNAIDARQTQQNKLSDQIKAADDELSKLNPSVPTLENAALPNQAASGLPPAGFDQLSSKLASPDGLMRDPKIQAAAVLDNYMQMQYQIVARQLTLLRDGASRDDRLVFLEVPTGIYAVPGRANRKIVQVRWEVTRWARICNPERMSLYPDQETNKVQPLLTAFRNRAAGACPTGVDSTDEWVWQNIVPSLAPAERLPVRAIEMVPQQTAVNVDQFYGRSNYNGISGVFSWIIGLGAQAKYQRQRETATRYITQETHTSAFGKGSSVFGWNFTPLPTEKYLAAGVRTTYAAVSVPKDAIGIELHGVACFSGQNDIPSAAMADQNSLDNVDPKACVQRSALVYIPSPRDMHPKVWSLGYRSVPAGQRITVTLHGERLSPQIGVLVNGVELKREIAIASHPAGSPPPSPEVNGVSGSFEYVSSDFMTLSFSVRDASRQPVITLVSPGFTQNLDYSALDYYLPRDSRNWSKDRRCDAVPMFYAPITVTGVKAAAIDAGSGSLSLSLTGTSLKNREVELLNLVGKRTGPCNDEFCRLKFQVEDLRKDPAINGVDWTFVVSPGKGAYADLVEPLQVSFANPLLSGFDKSTAPKASWIQGPDSSTPAKLHIEAAGFNLDSGLAFKIDGKDVAPSSLTPPERVSFDIDAPPEGVKTVRLSAARRGTALSDARDVNVPARPKNEEAKK